MIEKISALRFLQSRLATGVVANLYAQGVNLFIQLISVPILVGAWGVESYGLWLVLTAVPSYLVLSDLGFASAAMNDMTMSRARDDRLSMTRTLHSTLAYMAVLGLALLLIVFSIILTPSSWFQLAGLGPSTLKATTAAIVVYTGLSLSGSVLTACFQSNDHYALGISILATSRLLENIVLFVSASFFNDLFTAAVAMLVARALAIFVSFVIIRQKEPWLTFGFRMAEFSEIKRLLPSAIGIMLIPLAFSLSLQGIVIVIGLNGPLAAVAEFTVVRTAARLMFQAVGLVNHPLMPLLSAAFSAGDVAEVQRIRRINMVVTIIVVAPAVSLFLIFGPLIIKVWTSSIIVPGALFTSIIAVATGINCFWHYQGNLLLAVNRPQLFSYMLVAISALSTGCAALVVRRFGIEGVAMVVLGADLIMMFYIAIKSKLFFRSNLPLTDVI